jgi:hypothetical protein
MAHNTTTNTHFAFSADIDGVTVETDVCITIDIEEDYSSFDGDGYPVPSVEEIPTAVGSYVDNDIWIIDGDDEVRVDDGQAFRAAERAIIDFIINTDEGLAMVRQAFEDDCVSQAEEFYERSLEAR